MTVQNGDSFVPPSPEWLAAYVDGELEANGDLAGIRKKVEYWLDRNPKAQDDVLAWSRLKKIWDTTTPREPSEKTWASLQGAICHGLIQAPQPTAPRNRSNRRRGLMVLACVAAVILLGLGVTWHLWNPAEQSALPGNTHPSINVEPFLVAVDDEVEILSITGRDTETVVVGSLPVEGNIELATSGEVSLSWMEHPLKQSEIPLVGVEEDPPMIWAPPRMDP